VITKKNLWYKFRDESGIEVSHAKYLDSILGIRNCIVHHHGKIDAHDLKDGQCLTVNWIESKLAVGNQVTKTAEVVFDAA